MSPEITPEEIELIKSVKAGSKTAFSKLFKQYKPFVEKLLYTYIKDMDEARDIANIVFLKVYEKIAMFTDYSSFGGWLRILTKNVAIDYLRTVKQNKSLEDDESIKILNNSIESTEDLYVNKMMYEELLNLFDILPPSYRGVCKLFYINNMTVEQISEALNVPKGTIKSDLHRMRKIIKNHLKVSHHVKSSSTCTRSSRNRAPCKNE